MTNTPESEIRERLSELVPCIDGYCDKHGTTVDGNLDDGPEPAQCQFCYQDRFPAIDKIVALIEAYVQAKVVEAQTSLLERIYLKKRDVKEVRTGVEFAAVHHKDIDYEYWKLTNERLIGLKAQTKSGGKT